jgi:transcription-repair coupling factor (superfamily II helicase)
MEFLDKAVKALQSGQQPDFDKPLCQHTDIDLLGSAIIPDDYIHEVPMRLTLYKRIAGASDNSALKDLQVEMIDRFGLLPPETKLLFQISALKLIAVALGVKKIQLGERNGYLEFNNKPNIEPIKIIQLIQKYPKVYRLQGSSRLNITTQTSTAPARYDFMMQMLRLLG